MDLEPDGVVERRLEQPNALVLKEPGDLRAIEASDSGAATAAAPGIGAT